MVMTNCWRSRVGVDVYAKIAACGKELQEWEGSRVCMLKQRLVALHIRMEELRRVSDPESIREEKEVHGEYVRVSRANEDYWKQRAKMFWLAGGDANTRYFHTMASSRRKRNHIDRLKDENKVWLIKGTV